MGAKSSPRFSRTAWSAVLCLCAFALTCPRLFVHEDAYYDALAPLVFVPVIIGARTRPYAVVGWAALASPFLGPVAIAASPVAAVLVTTWAIGCAWIGERSLRRRVVAASLLLLTAALIVEAAGRLSERLEPLLLLHVAWLAAARWLTPWLVRGIAKLGPALRAVTASLAVGLLGAFLVGTAMWIDGYSQLAAARRMAPDPRDRHVLAINMPNALGMSFGVNGPAVLGRELLWENGHDDSAISLRDEAWIDAGPMAAPGSINGMTALYTDGATPVEDIRARLGEYDGVVTAMTNGSRLAGRWVGRIQKIDAPDAPAGAGAPIVFERDGGRVTVLSSAACRSDAWTVQLTLDMRIDVVDGASAFPTTSIFRHALDHGRQLYGSDAGLLGGLASPAELVGRRVLDVGYVSLDAYSQAPIDAVQFGFYDPANGERWTGRGVDGATFEANAVRIPVNGACASISASQAGREQK
jgi:hypothetical protein